MMDKIKKVESLLEDYYSTEDEFVRTDIPIIIMQNYVDWMIETIKNQQAEIDTLSMAHDAIHRELPKDKHTLIKSNIDKERTITSLRERLQELERELEETKLDESTIEFYKHISRLAVTGEKIAKKENKRYRELLEKTHRLAGIKKEIDYDLWKMIDTELEESEWMIDTELEESE